VYYNLSKNKKYAPHENHVSFTKEVLNENVSNIPNFQFALYSHDNFLNWKNACFCLKGRRRKLNVVSTAKIEGLEASSRADVSTHLKCIYSSKCFHHDCFRTLVRRFSASLICSEMIFCKDTYTRLTIWCFFGVKYIYHINNTFF